MAYRPVVAPPPGAPPMMMFTQPPGGGGDTAVTTNGWDPYLSKVELLLHCDGADGSTTVTDSGPDARIVTPNGTVAISTAQSKFGGASCALLASGNLGVSSPFTLPGDFTFEAFVYRTVAANFSQLVQFGNEAAGRFVVQITSLGEVQYDLYGTSSGTWTDRKVALNAWTHVVVQRSGSNLMCYIGGIAAGSALARSGTLGNTAALSLFSGNYDGYADEVRITTGVARYPIAFTPPTAPLAHS